LGLTSEEAKRCIVSRDFVSPREIVVGSDLTDTDIIRARDPILVAGDPYSMTER
jgi:hypothetical protein